MGKQIVGKCHSDWSEAQWRNLRIPPLYAVRTEGKCEDPSARKLAQDDSRLQLFVTGCREM